MAKSGLTTFHLDCVLDNDIKLIEDEYGITGFGVVVKLFQKAYGERGYYLEWDSEVALSFARRDCAGVGCNVVSEIVTTAIKRGIFDKEMYDKHKILTSKRMQMSYLSAVKRRERVEFIGDYSLLNDDQNLLSVYKNVKVVYKNKKNVCNFQQSKVKESKVKESKVNSNIQDSFHSSFILLMLNDKSEYPISVEQVDNWKKLYPNVNVEQELRNMKGWLEANPTKRKTKTGILRFVNTWLSKKQDKFTAYNIPTNTNNELLKETMELSKIDWLHDNHKTNEQDNELDEEFKKILKEWSK